MRSISGSFAALALLALLTVTAGAAGARQPAPPSPPSGGSAEISVNLVELPVEVTRGGEPVQGLTAADFEVREKGGKALPVVAFETVDLGGAGQPAAAGAASPSPLSTAARRHVFLLFDFASSRPERLRTGVAAARELVAQRLDPRDLVAVGAYMSTGEVPILLNFTADRAAADRTLATIDAALSGKAPAAGPAAGKGKDGDPLQLTGILFQSKRTEERNLSMDLLATLGKTDGTWGGFLIRNALGHSAALHQPNIDAVRTDHVTAMAEAMAGLGDALRPVTGRKYLALFSEGWPMSLADQATPDSYKDPTFGGSELLGRLRDALGGLVRSGWVLHAVDLNGARVAQMSDRTSGLFYFANETGGSLVSGTSRLAEGLGRVLAKSAHAYVLTVQADDAPADGAFHPLEVRLKSAEGRVKLRSSGGYFAPLPFQRQKGAQRMAEAARLVAGDDERDELGVQVAAVPLRPGGQGPTFGVLVEVPGRALLASPGPQLGLEVFGYAMDAAGVTGDFFAQAVALDRDKVGDRLAQGGVRVLGRLAPGEGAHRLRLLVRDRADGRTSLLTVPLPAAAPAATAAGGSSLDAFFLPPSGDAWVIVHPQEPVFAVQGREVLPAAQAALAQAGEAQLFLVGRGLTGPGRWIRGRILDASGKPAQGGEVELLSVSPGEAGEPDLMVGRLRAGTLPAGPYLLELRLGGAKGAPQAVSVRPFAVAGR